MEAHTIIPVILAGGQGTRLWPASLPDIPKQFITFSDTSLITKSIERVQAINPPEIIIVTGQQYTPLFSQKLLPELQKKNIPPQSITIIAEPAPRNTAPAIALATRYVEDHYPNATLLVVTADHLIEPISTFAEDIYTATTIANLHTEENNKQGYLVTFGIPPTHPETGYGYIELGDSIHTGHKVIAFKEKPTQEIAQQYIEQGNFLWNSGMFCFPASLMIKEMSTYVPELYTAILDKKSPFTWICRQEQGFTLCTPHNIAFETLNKISIDYAIMEHTTYAAVIHAHFDWNDIGNWDEAINLLEHTNTTSQYLSKNAHNNTIYSDFTVGICGVSDIIVVAKNNKILILRKGQGQAISDIAKKDKDFC